MPVPVFGITTSGNVYGAGINLSIIEHGKTLPAQFVRIDFGNKKITYKTLPDPLSNNGPFWIVSQDGMNNVYLSMNNPVRKILKFNLKDSIKYTDLGNAFVDGHTLAYSMSMGRDGKMYFGGSSGPTYWSCYDPTTNTFEKHPAIDSNNDYVLSIAGDSDYVYAQTGQRSSVQLWSIRKKDDFKKLLIKITNLTRIELYTKDDGIYASFNSDTLKGLFKLVKGDIIKIDRIPSTKNIIGDEVNIELHPKINTVFDAVDNQIFFSLNDKPFDSITISSPSIVVPIRKIFSFSNDHDNIYFVGDYYGNYYRYSLKNHASYLLGSTGYNVYSFLQTNDSIMYFGGYPSGYLMRWNRYRPWNTNKFIGNKLVEAIDANANPKIVGYWKSSAKPPAGFHHTEQLVEDAFGNIVGAGNVIRIGNAASIGVYNIAKDSMYGVAYNAYSGMGFGSIAKWKKLIIYAMNNQYGKKPKLYFYNSASNKMTDSLDLGYEDYGKIQVKGDILFGIAKDRVYKLNLSEKKILETYSLPKNSITDSYFLSNRSAIVNTKNKIPPSIIKTIYLTYSNYCEVNGSIYGISGNYIIRISGLLGK